MYTRTEQLESEGGMKCANCGRNADTLDARLLTADGDFACSSTCEAEYKRKRDYFLSEVVPDDRKMGAWWNGQDYP
jgi:hypothetical protein